MKKVIIILMALSFTFFLNACGDAGSDVSEIPYNFDHGAFDREHNARLSLDYDGIYKGVLPCADCEGIETIITLDREGNFIKSWVYQGKDDYTQYTYEGNYTWDDSGSIITLHGVEEPNKYFVGENILFHLDSDGNRITGSLMDLYQLHKQ